MISVGQFGGSTVVQFPVIKECRGNGLHWRLLCVGFDIGDENYHFIAEKRHQELQKTIVKVLFIESNLGKEL